MIKKIFNNFIKYIGYIIPASIKLKAYSLLYYLLIKNDNFESVLKCKFVSKIIFSDEENKKLIINKNFNQKSLDIFFPRLLSSIVAGTVNFSDDEKIKIVDKVALLENTRLYDLLYLFFYFENLGSKLKYNEFLNLEIKLKNYYDYLIFLALIIHHGTEDDFVKFHKSNWYHDLDEKSFIKSLNFSVRILYRKGYHELNEVKYIPIIQKQSKLNLINLYLEKDIKIFFHLRSIRAANKFNSIIGYNDKKLIKNSVNCVGQEIDLSAQIFQLPYVKSQFLKSEIQSMIIDERLKQIAENYIPGIEVIPRENDNILKNKKNKFAPKFHRYFGKLDNNKINNLRFIPIKYSFSDHEKCVIDARKSGILKNFLNKCEKENLFKDTEYITKSKFICLSLRSNISNKIRYINYEKLYDKIQKLIDNKYKVVNITPNLTDIEISEIEKNIKNKIIYPKFDLFNDLNQVAYLMYKSEFNIVINNNLMDIGGATGNLTYVLDPHRRLNYYIKNNSYYFWSNVKIINE